MNAHSDLSTNIKYNKFVLLKAIFGYLIFHEVTSLLWWSGMSLIIIGLILIVSDSDKRKLN